MTPRALIIAGLAVLVFAWAGPLPRLVPASFAAHMALHMTVVGVGVPLLAIGLAARFGGAVLARDPRLIAIVVTLLDLVIVWGWHTPLLHHASRSSPMYLALEQASFAGVTLAIWLLAFAGPPLLGALSLFFTSMHMTLLGALLGLAPRPSFAGHRHDGMAGLGPLADQQLGGIIMLAVGSVVYLAAALTLVARVLRRTGP